MTEEEKGPEGVESNRGDEWEEEKEGDVKMFMMIYEYLLSVKMIKLVNKSI